MANIRFKQFTDGSSQTIAGETVASWGTASTETIFDEAATSGVSVSIEVGRSPNQVAPEDLKFDYSTTGFDDDASGQISAEDPTYHSHYVFWRCRSHQYNFTAPTQILLMDAADGGNRAAADMGIGRIWNYVAQSPGLHIFDVVVHEPASGKLGKATVSINVGDPATYFSGTRTLFVDTTGANTNAPAGAQTFTDIDAAIGAMIGQRTTPHRVVLERGQTHSLNTARSITGGGNLVHFRIEALSDAEGGSGAAPIVQDNTSVSGGSFIFTDNAQLAGANANTEFVLSGIEFVGPFDPTDASGRAPAFVNHRESRRSCEYILHNKCTIRGFDRAFGMSHSTPHRSCRFTACDIVITDWVSCGIFAGSNRQFTFLGCRIAQNPDAISDLSDNGPVSSAVGYDVTSGWCVRVSATSRLVIRACDSFTNQGWSPGFGSTFYALQATWRIFANAEDTWAPVCITNSVFEGGRFAFYIRPSSGSFSRRPVNGLIEGNFILGGFQASSAVELAQGHTAWRKNQMMIAGDQTAASDGGTNVSTTAAVVARQGGNSSGISSNDSRSTVFTDNTAICLRNVQPSSGFLNTSDVSFSNVTQSGNRVDSPNAGDNNDGPWVTTQGFTPRFKGYRTTTSQLFSAYATPLAAGVIYTKADGSGADTKPNYDPLP